MEEAPYTISNESLLDFLHVAEPRAQYFPTAARPLLKTFARHAAPELPVDIWDEVVSQSFEYLIQSGPQFQPARGSAKAFLKILTRQAVRKIRADYCPPGRRTRPDHHDRSQGKPKVISLSDINLENVLVNRDAVDELDRKCEVKAILRRAPAKVAVALILIYFAGEKVSAAARAVGMSRFALNREIARFMRTVRGTGASIEAAQAGGTCWDGADDADERSIPTATGVGRETLYPSGTRARVLPWLAHRRPRLLGLRQGGGAGRDGDPFVIDGATHPNTSIGG